MDIPVPIQRQMASTQPVNAACHESRRLRHNEKKYGSNKRSSPQYHREIPRAYSSFAKAPHVVAPMQNRQATRAESSRYTMGKANKIHVRKNRAVSPWI